MSRELFEVELGFAATDENSNITRYQLIHGSGAPGGDTGPQDDAPIGSIYIDYTNGYLYQKRTDTNTVADWKRAATLDDVTGINMRVAKVATTEAAIANDTNRNLTTTPFTDDEGTQLTAADFATGDLIVFDVDGIPVVKEVTVVSSPNIQVSDAGIDALAANDLFLVLNYLADTPGDQEGAALALYDGTNFTKVGDVDWNFATGINLSSGYTPGSGDITPSDTVESAIQKLDGNVDDLTTTVGVSQGDTDMGTYTGTIISDNQNAKQNIQELETDLDAVQTLTGVAAESTDLGTFTGSVISDNVDIKTAFQELETYVEGLGIANVENEAVTTSAVLDSVLVDDVYAVKWLVHAVDEANNTVSAWEVWAGHDGEAAADAANVDDTVYAKLKIGGGVAGASISVDLNGTGASQAMRLNVSASNTTKFRAKRLEVIDIT